LGSGRVSVKVVGKGTEVGGRVVGVVDWRKFVRRGIVGGRFRRARIRRMRRVRREKW